MTTIAQPINVQEFGTLELSWEEQEEGGPAISFHATGPN
jgi:hypothetical protein